MLRGRESETRAVDRLVAGARIGNGGALLLSGEAGIGKTALLLHSREHLDGFRLMQATGTETEKDIPFAGLHALLTPVLDLLPTIPGPQADALASALALRPGPAADRFATGAATLSLLCRAAEPGPVAILVDDLHLLDLPSVEAILFAARRLPSDPVAMLLAARPDELEVTVDGVATCALPGLDVASAGALVRSAAEVPVTDEQVARLHQTTAGNPLAMLELGDSIDVLDRTGPEIPLPLTGPLTASFGRRLDQLSGQARSTLLVAAVANGDIGLTTAACARLGLDAQRIVEAQDAGLVDVVGGRLDFRHPLVRTAAYSGRPADERRAAHRAVADALPAEDVDRRAWHRAESSWLPDAEVAGMLVEAAENASARSAYSVASRSYERAAWLSPDPADRPALLMHAAENAWVAGSGRRAIGLLDEIDAGLAPHSQASSALALRAAITIRYGSLGEARGMLEQAVESSESLDDQVILLADAVQASFYMADTGGGLRLANRIAPLLESADTTKARALGTMAIGIAKTLAGQDGSSEMRAAVPLMTASVDLRHDLRRLPWLMQAALFIRDSQTGDSVRSVVDEVRGQVGIGALPALLFHVARDQATTDSWTRARANYTEAYDLAEETGQLATAGIVLAGLAWLESRQGDEAACRDHAARAAAECVDHGFHLGEVWALFALGDLELALGNAREAADRLADLVAHSERRGLTDPDLFPGPELTDALLRLGDRDRAEQVAADFHHLATAKGRPWSCARDERTQAMLADDDAVPAHCEAALVLHAETPDVFETARTLLVYGGRLRRAGHRVDARPRLREALDVFTDLGADRWADHAAAELDATGERVQRRSTAGISSLTPQELQVSMLLAEGRTTREAAAALFLSPKTVEYHLRKVYAKLSIRSRAELADVLGEKVVSPG